MLEIRLLGQFSLHVEGRPVAIPSRPAQSLLAYLALNPGIPQRRERLAGLLWPEVPDADARRNLRGALWRIRRSAGGQLPLQTDDLSVVFSSGPQVWVDAQALSQKLGPESQVGEITAAVNAYGGELLPGFYEEWVIVERERLQAVFESRIKLLLDRLEETACWAEVIEWGERWLALAGSAEPAYRALIKAYAAQGDLAKAAATFQRCSETLRRDLGVEPSAETTHLFASLSAGGPAQAPGREISPPPQAAAGASVLPAPGQDWCAVPGLDSGPPEGPAESSTGRPPFKGLQYFDEADGEIFFGREKLAAHLLDRLGLPGEVHGEGESLLFIVGASGSGKSSLARAGLVPAVRRITAGQTAYARQRQGYWNILVLTPSTHPVEILAAGLIRGAGPVSAAANLADDMMRDARSLRFYLHQLPARLLLVVDQMEELFTLCRDEVERRAYIDNLLSAAGGGSCKVIFTLRADFYAHCAQYENLRAALSAHQEYIGPMSAAELRRAIEEPVRASGDAYEPGLVDLILREVGSEPGSLPLLSHALLETWNRRRGHTLSLAGYAEACGVRGAIARTAENIFGRLTPHQQRIARSIFIRLTEFGEAGRDTDLPALDTRRRVAPEELVLRAEDRPGVEEVLNLLAEARLLTVSAQSVEVAHEALIREWPTLRLWLSEDREGLRLHRRITEAAQSWEELECDAGELLRGARLAQAQEWASGHLAELNDLERDFLAASQAFAEQEAVQREAARQREVDSARRLAQAEQRRAEDQARSAQRLRWLAAGLAMFLLVAAVMASLAIQQRDRVGSQQRLAVSRELAASALANLKVDPERSILLALEAVRTADTQEGVRALHESVQASRLQKVFKTQYPWAVRVVISPDGERLAATSTNQANEFMTEIWEIAGGKRLLAVPGALSAESWPDGKRLATISTGADGKRTLTFWDASFGRLLSTVTLDGRPGQHGLNGNFSPDWKQVAEAFSDGTTVVSSLETGEPVLTLGSSGDLATRVVDFSPDGQRLLASTGSTVGIWEIPSGRQLATLPSAGYGVQAAAYAPDREEVALGLGPVVKVVDAAKGQTLFSLAGHTGFVQGIRYDPAGTRIATAGADGLAIIWDDLTGQALMTLAGHTAALVDVTFAPFRDQAATASLDGTVRLWNISSSGDGEAAPGFNDPFGKAFTSIAFSPDGQRLAVSGGSLPGSIFEAATGRSLVSLAGAFGNWQGSAAFSPDGSILATTSGEPQASLWDPASGQKLRTLAGFHGWIGDLAFSPDGRRLAAISFDGWVRMWDPASGDELLSFQAFTETLETTQVLGIDFSPDGSRLATAGGHTPRVWDARTGQELLSLPAQVENVYAVAFNPDGTQLAIGIALGAGASIWDAQSGQKRIDLSGHQGSVQAIVFSRDGRQVITGSVDGAIKVWDALTGEEQLTLARQSAQITGLALSPDGSRLAASSDNGTARIYLLREGDLVQAALRRLTRWLTPQECQEYLHTSACPARP